MPIKSVVSCLKEDKQFVQSQLINDANEAAIRLAAEDTDQYFNAVAMSSRCGKKGRSNRKQGTKTLASLPNRPDEDSSQQLANEHIESIGASNDLPTTAELNCANNLFADWWHQMHLGGFSLLVYGLGSKRHLLRQFKSAHLSDQMCVEIDGYHPEAAPKAILTALIDEFIGDAAVTSATGGVKSLVDMAKLIGDTLINADLTLYIVFHSLDGPQLRTDKAIEALVSLVASPAVRMIASLDHRLCQLLWDRGRLTRMASLWCPLPMPMRPYVEELPTSSAHTGRAVEYVDSAVGGCSGESGSAALQLSGLRHLMASLTHNARELFVMLARRQLERPGEPWPLDEIYTACRDGMLVTSELTLHAHLREFRDHGLVRLRFDAAGQAGDSAVVPLAAETLTQFLAAFGDDCDL